jgi:hypothetical protein
MNNITALKIAWFSSVVAPVYLDCIFPKKKLTIISQKKSALTKHMVQTRISAIVLIIVMLELEVLQKL